MKTKRYILSLCLLPMIFMAADAFAAAAQHVTLKTTQQVYGQRFALCIGVNGYQAHPALNCAVSDATAMAGVFEAYGFDEVVLLTDATATRGNILDEMERLQAKAGPDDLFVFYFAGHGWTIRESAGLTGVLVPVDCRKGHEAQDGISMGVLKTYSDRMQNRHSLFLMDACYSGYGLIGSDEGVQRRVRRRLSSRMIEELTDSPSVQVLTAGGELDRAFESDGHGIFTRYVLECLRGAKAVARDGVISGVELAAHVRDKVRSETGGWQSPQFGAVGEGDVLFTMGDADAGTAVAMAR